MTEKGLISEDHNEDHLQRVLMICQEKITSLEELPEFCGYFFSDDYTVDPKAEKKVMSRGNAGELAEQVIAALEPVSADHWNVSGLETAFAKLAADNGQEKPFMWWPMTRFAVSGVSGGPDFLPMLEVMGRDLVLGRLGKMID